MSEQASSPETQLHVTVWQDGHSMIFTGVQDHECVALVRVNFKNIGTFYRMAKAIQGYAKEWMEKEKEEVPK